MFLPPANSYRDRQTEDFSQGPGTDLAWLPCFQKRMAAIKYIWSRLLLNGRKRQLSEDFVLLQSPLTSKYLLLDRSDAAAPVVAAMVAVCVAEVMAHGRSLFSFDNNIPLLARHGIFPP